MEPPNKGHIRDNTNSAVVSFVELLSSFGGLKCITTIGKHIFGTFTSVLYREVYYIVSLSRRVHYRRFHYHGLIILYIVFNITICTLLPRNQSFYRQIISHEKGGAVSGVRRPMVRTATEYKIVVTGLIGVHSTIQRITCGCA